MLFQLTGATWLDPAPGFIIAAFAIHEGREAWEGELVKTATEPEYPDPRPDQDPGIGGQE